MIFRKVEKSQCEYPAEWRQIVKSTRSNLHRINDDDSIAFEYNQMQTQLK